MPLLKDVMILYMLPPSSFKLQLLLQLPIGQRLVADVIITVDAVERTEQRPRTPVASPVRIRVPWWFYYAGDTILMVDGPFPQPRMYVFSCFLVRFHDKKQQ